jgi:hypothetical protein
MSAAYFEEERQQMVAVIKVIAKRLADEIGKTALDDRVLMARAKVPRHEFVPIEVQDCAYRNRPAGGPTIRWAVPLGRAAKAAGEISTPGHRVGACRLCRTPTAVRPLDLAAVVNQRRGFFFAG